MSRPVEELIRLAMVYAEQDRRSFAEANGSNQVAAEANELADAFRAYRMKRWGRTTMEAQIESATLVPIDELRRRASQETGTARRCRCGQVEWEDGARRISCGDGSDHYVDLDCVSAAEMEAPPVSCKCPAPPGRDCWLTVSECNARAAANRLPSPSTGE